jgi:5,6,7,8-tetrahydromethanopterin hydro-lyase
MRVYGIHSIFFDALTKKVFAAPLGRPFALLNIRKDLVMSKRFLLRTGEALVEGAEDYLCAEPEIVLGELDGPVGQALAQLVGNQVKGHTRVFALLASDVQVRPVTLMVSKVTVNDSRYTNILMGTVQAAIAHGVLDAVRAGDIPKKKAFDLGIIYSVWLDPAILTVPKGKIDHANLFAVHRQATAKVIHKAMEGEPDIDWLLDNQDKVEHYFHQQGLAGNI